MIGNPKANRYFCWWRPLCLSDGEKSCECTKWKGQMIRIYLSWSRDDDLCKDVVQFNTQGQISSKFAPCVLNLSIPSDGQVEGKEPMLMYLDVKVHGACYYHTFILAYHHTVWACILFPVEIRQSCPHYLNVWFFLNFKWDLGNWFTLIIQAAAPHYIIDRDMAIIKM